MLRHPPRNPLLVLKAVLLTQQDCFSSVQDQEDEIIFLDISREAGIINNHQGRTRKVACW
jgi:hypothetical protein